METLFIYIILITSFFAAMYSTRWLSKPWHVVVAYFFYFYLQAYVFLT